MGPKFELSSSGGQVQAVATILSSSPIASINSVTPWFIVTTRCGICCSVCVTPQDVYSTGKGEGDGGGDGQTV